MSDRFGIGYDMDDYWYVIDYSYEPNSQGWLRTVETFRKVDALLLQYAFEDKPERVHDVEWRREAL